MTMKPLIIALTIASTAAFSLAQAQSYQWKDSNGRTIISDSPPPGGVRPAKTVPPTGTANTEAAKPADAPKSMAERDMDFKKRQQEAKEKAEKEGKESAANAEKKENCQRARQQLAALESGQRISSTDASGERRFLEDAERQREIERTRKYVSDSCK
jgi:hypothetical protein